ncbi:hypothetical protein BMS3Abin04_01292 [bacterium BMS3Abin04]|nr:hypothetical protein BMS3Abin04_01292 [bacterium BMS3Abin04]
MAAQYAHLKHIVKPKFELGILIEGTDLFNSRATNKFTDSGNYKVNILEKNIVQIYPISLYISGRLIIIGNLSFEFRPGIIFAGEPYSGFEYGFFLRYKMLNKKIILIGGVNLHDNIGAGHNSLVSTGETITEIGGSVGYQFTKSFAGIVSYYKPSKEIEYYSEYSNDYIDEYTYKLKYIIKFGFDFTFNW